MSNEISAYNLSSQDNLVSLLGNENKSSPPPQGSFWSRHKVTILSVGGGMVVGAGIATALIASGVGLVALPLIAYLVLVPSSGLIGGLVGDAVSCIAHTLSLQNKARQLIKFFDALDLDDKPRIDNNSLIE